MNFLTYFMSPKDDQIKYDIELLKQRKVDLELDFLAEQDRIYIEIARLERELEV